MMLVVPKARSIDAFSALQAMLEGRGGIGHVGSTVFGGCFREEVSNTTRFVGVIMAAISNCAEIVQVVTVKKE